MIDQLRGTSNKGRFSPLGLFDDEQIDNDLAKVDAAIVDYYNLAQTA